MRGTQPRNPPSEAVTAVQAEGTRLVRYITDTRGAVALVVKRQTRGLVPEVVDVGRGLPVVGSDSQAQVADRVARQLGIERDRAGGERPAEGVQARRIRIRSVRATAADVAPAGLLVLEL